MQHGFQAGESIPETHNDVNYTLTPHYNVRADSNDKITKRFCTGWTGKAEGIDEVFEGQSEAEVRNKVKARIDQG